MKRRGIFKKTVTRHQSPVIQTQVRNGGEFYCDVWEQNISQSVCIVRDTRNYCGCEVACPKMKAA